MKSVRIAELKARLSEHLRQVRRGRTLVVLDRNTPIARLVPYEGDSASLTIRRPAGHSPSLHNVPLPPPLRIGVDILELLLAERQSDR